MKDNQMMNQIMMKMLTTAFQEAMNQKKMTNLKNHLELKE